MRSFVGRDLVTLKTAFTTYTLDLLLEYNSVIWSPQCIADIHTLEKVQSRYSKRLPPLHGLSYSGRVEMLGL